MSDDSGEFHGNSKRQPHKRRTLVLESPSFLEFRDFQVLREQPLCGVRGRFQRALGNGKPQWKYILDSGGSSLGEPNRLTPPGIELFAG